MSVSLASPKYHLYRVPVGRGFTGHRVMLVILDRHKHFYLGAGEVFP